MKALTPRTPLFYILSYSSRSSSCYSSLSHFSTSSSPSTSSYYPSRRHEEEARNVRVSVWWDFENCGLPGGVNVFKIAHSITAAVRANGIKGPIQITAFGDVLQLSRSNQEALSSTGINLTHIPNGGKNSADRSLLVDLMYWVSQNPPPAHLFIISGDRDFASILHRLRMNNYNILLACPDHVSGVLCSAASIMWPWKALVRGENLTGKHFNQPPDGPYGSWYGHYKMPLESPFPVLEQPASSRIEESSGPGSEANAGPIPVKVMKHIHDILQSYPEGVSIMALRAELNEKMPNIDKRLYGYKKFSCFLLAMPQILKIQPVGDGKFLVCGITQKKPESINSNSGTSAIPTLSDGDQDSASETSKVDSENEDSSITNCAGQKSQFPPESVDGKSSLPSAPIVSDEDTSRKVQGVSPPGEGIGNIVTLQSTEDHLNKYLVPEGFLRKIWRRWFGRNPGGSVKSTDEEKELINSAKTFGNTKSDEITIQPTSRSADPIRPASLSSPTNDSVQEEKPFRTSEMHGDKSVKTQGFLSKISSLFKFEYSSSDSSISSDQSNDKPSHMVDQCVKRDIFSENSFWADLESFLGTPKGSDIVAQSTSRLQMAQNLQEEGPMFLRSLGESDLLHLVGLMILEKKWVEETPSQSSPFKLTWTTGHSNGLGSIFLGAPSQSELQSPSKQASKRTLKNLPHTGLSPPVINKKTSEKARIEILADCQKLVNEIMRQYPQGFNLGCFRKMFYDRFGYKLDLKKLGYQKLISLLQIMPGIKLEGTYIIPSGKVSNGSNTGMSLPSIQENANSSDSELSDGPKKDNSTDSQWEELGPVEDTNRSMQLGLYRHEKEETGRQVHHNYEPSVSDDDLSDSDDEALTSVYSGRDEKPKMNGADRDSSLLQILDSWYNTKEDTNGADASQNVDSMVNCSKSHSKPSSNLSGGSLLSENSKTNFARKQRPLKSYTFVSNSDGDGKDDLVDGILGTLKKSGQSRMQS